MLKLSFRVLLEAFSKSKSGSSSGAFAWKAAKLTSWSMLQKVRLLFGCGPHLPAQHWIVHHDVKMIPGIWMMHMHYHTQDLRKRNPVLEDFWWELYNTGIASILVFELWALCTCFRKFVWPGTPSRWALHADLMHRDQLVHRCGCIHLLLVSDQFLGNLLLGIVNLRSARGATVAISLG